MKPISLSLIFIACLSFLQPLPVYAVFGVDEEQVREKVILDGPYDHSALDQFLKQYVNAQGDVDYAAAKADPSLLKQYMNQLAGLPFHEFEGWPREEQLALWLNAYHAGLLYAILQDYPISTVNDIPGFWEETAVHIGVYGYSLNRIREEQLIDSFRDEKILLALSCAAKGCPPMPREAFTGPRVEGQLYLAARSFVNDPRFNEINPEEKRVRLSRLFKWHAESFVLDFGSTDHLQDLEPAEGAVLSFVAYYLNDPAKLEFLERRNYRIKYGEMDWSLNDQALAPAGGR